MSRSFTSFLLCIVLIASLMPVSLLAQSTVNLPKPKTESGKPLMEALKERKSSREFSARNLPPQLLSNLLWAAAGENRPGKRTVPSAMNWQLNDVYVLSADGVYLYQAGPHALKVISNQDLRALSGKQRFVKEAPINLVYVADFEKAGAKLPDETAFVYAGAEAGGMGQNVYLFCASEGLSTVIRAMVDKEKLAKAMKLGPSQKIILTQTVGYLKNDK